ncbi:MAG: MliC family protein [Burkholderiales bacterium]|nr:MliC family protein [Burkholderiales bacterium]
MRQGSVRIVAAFGALSLAGCGGAKLWPFGEPSERARAPADAIAYRCDGGRAFYVRMIENGAAAWVILPEREIRLDRTGAAAGTNYAHRDTRLELKGTEASLYDGATPLFTGCKRAS